MFGVLHGKVETRNNFIPFCPSQQNCLNSACTQQTLYWQMSGVFSNYGDKDGKVKINEKNANLSHNLKVLIDWIHIFMRTLKIFGYILYLPRFS